jgi:hypothetical protein
MTHENFLAKAGLCLSNVGAIAYSELNFVNEGKPFLKVHWLLFIPPILTLKTLHLVLAVY